MIPVSFRRSPEALKNEKKKGAVTVYNSFANVISFRTFFDEVMGRPGWVMLRGDAEPRRPVHDGIGLEG